MLIAVLVYLLFLNITCGARILSTKSPDFLIDKQILNANTNITRDIFIDDDETNSSGNFENTEAILTHSDKRKTSTTLAFDFEYGDGNEEPELPNLRHVDEAAEAINKNLSKNITKNLNDSIINSTLKETLDKDTQEKNVPNVTTTFTLIAPPEINLEKNNSISRIVTTTIVPEVNSDYTISQITTTTKKTISSSTSAASFFKSIKWYYWLLISLIIPVIAMAVGGYYYFRKRQNTTRYAGTQLFIT